jgi:hypothetical protein
MYSFEQKPLCLNMDTNMFFDRYEEDQEHARRMDILCTKCPAQRQCLAYGVSNKEWGVWGGVYLEDGKISKEFNQHKKQEDWFSVWSNATMEIK